MSVKPVSSRMARPVFMAVAAAGLWMLGVSSAFGEADALRELREEVRQLKAHMAADRRAYEVRIEQLQQAVDRLSPPRAAAPPGEPVVKPEDDVWSSVIRFVEAYRLGFELVVDANYYGEDADSPVAEMMSALPGFTEGIVSDPEAHHHDPEEGFNLREVELGVSGELPRYFKARALFAFYEEGAEVEEAVFETTGLPAGLTIMGGKFLSRFGYINRLHPHDWDFVDRPLIYELTLGDHGLLEKGIQFRWRAPTPFGLRFGLEVLQGENEGTFKYLDGHDVPEYSGPRLGVGWVKSEVALSPRHGLRFGLFGAAGRDQELRDYSGDGAADASLSGDSWFFGGEAVYTYNSGRPEGYGDVTLVGEYFYRKKDLKVFDSPSMPTLTGRHQRDRQDGCYIQALYGFLPRWRAGLRWDQVGMTNESRFPDGRTERYGSSYRLTGMVDWSPADASYLRFQASRGRFAVEDGDEDYWQFFTQLVLTLGAGCAHE